MAKKRKRKRNPSDLEKALPWLVGGGLVAAFAYNQSQAGAAAPVVDATQVSTSWLDTMPVSSQAQVEASPTPDPWSGTLDPSFRPLADDSGMVTLDPSAIKFDEPYQDKATVSLGECIQAMKNGNPFVFDFPRPVANYKHIPVGQMNKKRIVITNLADLKAVCDNLVLPAFMVYKAGKPALQREAEETVISWLNYNEFVVGPDLLEDITDVFDEMGCKQDTDRAWWGDLTYPGIYHPVSKCDLYKRAKATMTPEALHKWNFQGVIARFKNNGLGLILEYTAARYAQIVFVAALDPKKAKSMVGDLLNLAATATGLAISITAGVVAGTASAVPIVGWIVAGIAVIISAISAIFAAQSTIDATRSLRRAISDKVDDILRNWFNVPGGMQKIFPAYWSPQQSNQDFALLAPAHYPMDDIRDPLFMVYALVWTNQVKAVPQLPFHYLKIGFDFPVSIDAVTKDLLILAPSANKAGVPFMGYNEKFLPQGQIDKIVW